MCYLMKKFDDYRMLLHVQAGHNIATAEIVKTRHNHCSTRRTVWSSYLSSLSNFSRDPTRPQICPMFVSKELDPRPGQETEASGAFSCVNRALPAHRLADA